MEKINSGIIVSHNSNYAYKFRTKANSLGLKLGYKRTLQELIEYLMFEKEGIVFVDIKSRTYHKYLSFTIKPEVS